MVPSASDNRPLRARRSPAGRRGAAWRVLRTGAAGLGLFLAAGFHGARAESVFAREGIGEWLDGYDVRGFALGSTGIGVVDPNNFTALNPAATAFSASTLGHVSLTSLICWTGDGDATARRASTDLSGLGLHVDLPEHLGVRLLLEPATNASYAFEQSIPTGSEDIERDVVREEGSRGLTRYLAGLSWRGGRNWALGVSLGVLAGSLVDRTSFIFEDSAAAAGYSNGEDRRELRFHARPYYGCGFLARPTPRVSLGGFFSSGASPQVTETYRSFADQAYTLDTRRVKLPLAMGAGAGLLIAPRWRLSADLVWRKWEDFTLDGRELPAPGVGPFRNTLRWGVGIERVLESRKGEGLLSAIAWRAGFTWIPWYVLDASGDGVDEWRVSAGAAVPIQRERGSIDVALAYGRRGSLEQNGLEEEYLSLAFAFTFARVLREY